MMKHSSILKWGHNHRNSAKGTRTWIHPPEALQQGHVAYLVKFLGNTEVDQPKGIDVVKEGIKKLKFTQQLRRSEGAKTPKIELTISVDGVAIQEPKNKRIYHQYPLHRISYCADDKSDKKFFSFIAKEADSDKHSCFVFVSDKLAEEITLTIGQAFDLAYRRFLETSGKDLEMRKKVMILQKRVQELEKENGELNNRLLELQRSGTTNGQSTSLKFVNGTSTPFDKSFKTPSVQSPPKVPARNFEDTKLSPSQELLQSVDFSNGPTVGRRLENLLLEDEDDFDPRADIPRTLQNGSTNNGHHENNLNNNNNSDRDIFGAPPFVPGGPGRVVDGTQNEGGDPFGMGDFTVVKDYETAIGVIDKKLSEMRAGFSRGLSFGNDDFSLEGLGPSPKSN